MVLTAGETSTLVGDGVPLTLDINEDVASVFPLIQVYLEQSGMTNVTLDYLIDTYVDVDWQVGGESHSSLVTTSVNDKLHATFVPEGTGDHEIQAVITVRIPTSLQNEFQTDKEEYTTNAVTIEVYDNVDQPDQPELTLNLSVDKTIVNYGENATLTLCIDPTSIPEATPEELAAMLSEYSTVVWQITDGVDYGASDYVQTISDLDLAIANGCVVAEIGADDLDVGVGQLSGLVNIKAIVTPQSEEFVLESNQVKVKFLGNYNSCEFTLKLNDVEVENGQPTYSVSSADVLTILGGFNDEVSFDPDQQYEEPVLNYHFYLDGQEEPVYYAQISYNDDPKVLNIPLTNLIASPEVGREYEIKCVPYLVADEEGYNCAEPIIFKVIFSEEEQDEACNIVEGVSYQGNVVENITLAAGDGPITLTLPIEDLAVEIIGWETTYPGGLDQEVYGQASIPADPNATFVAGDYTVTVNYDLYPSLDGEILPTVHCTKVVNLHVAGDNPTPPTPPTDVLSVYITGNTNVCPNDEVTLIANIVPANASFRNIVWLRNENPIFDANNQAHVGPVFTFVPEELFGDSEDRTVTVEVSYGECNQPVRDTRTIEYLPDAPEIHITLSEDTVCVGGQITATIDTTGDDWDTDLWDLNNPIYSWYVNGVEVPGEHMGVITIPMLMTGTYGFAVKINTPICGVSVQSEPDTVHVFDAMPLTITGDNVVCQNATATLTATEISGATYAWAGPDPAAADVTGNVLTTTIPGVYAVTATLEGGCLATAEFTVYQFGGDLQITADQMNVCPGTTVVMNANLDGWFNENISYEWSTGATSSTIAAVVGETTTYTVTAYAQPQNQNQADEGENDGDEQGDIEDEGDNDQPAGTVEDHSTVCALTSSIEIKVGTNQNILTEVTTGEEPVCVGGQIVLNASSNVATQDNTEGEDEEGTEEELEVNPEHQPEVEPANEATYTYIWYKNGIVIPGENQPSITVTPTHSGIYTFAAKAVVSACNTSEVSAPVEVMVNAAPIVNITGTQNVVNGATTAELTAQVYPADGDYTYAWSNGGAEPSITVNQAGAYNVTVTDANQCTAISLPFQVTPVTAFHIDIEGNPTPCITEDVFVEATYVGENYASNLVVAWYANGQPIDDGDADGNPLTFRMPAQDLYNQLHVTQFDLCIEVGDPLQCDDDNVISECYNIDIRGEVQLDHLVVLNNGSDVDHVCEGAQLDLTAMIQDEEGGYYEDPSLTYVWMRNGIVISGAHESHFSEQAWIYDSDPVDYVYSVYIDFGNGCVSETVECEPINVRRNPIVTIDGNPNVCYNGVADMNVQLVAWVDGYYDPNATYTWYESGQALNNDAGIMNYYIGHFDPNYVNPLIFTVEVKNGDGCSTIADPFYVNVYDKPIVNITGDAEAVCTNGSVTLRANLNNYNDPMLVFQWYKNEYNVGNLIPGATHEIETFYPTEATTYVVAVTHLMDYSFPDCIGIDSFRVNISGIPQVTVHNDLDTPENPNVTEICEGRSIKFDAYTEGGIEGEAIYTWYRNGELVENVTGDIYVDAPLAVDGYPTTYIYSVIVNQGFSGCESELTFFDTITVNPNPAIQLVSDPIICSEDGNNVVLTANMDVVPTGVQYRWLEDNAEFLVTDTNSIALHKDYSENPYHFSVQIVNEYGCTGQSDIDVYVNDAPVVAVTITDTVVCEDGQVTLAAALQDWNATSLTYQWYDGETAIEDATSLTYTATPAFGEEHHYHIVINQTNSGCVANSEIIDVEVVAKPVIASVDAENMPEDRIVCDGYQVNMTANVQGGVEGGEVFTWYRNGVLIEGANQATFSEVLTAENGESTTYTYGVAVVQGTPGCESEIFDVDTITVNPNPVLQLVTDPIVCNNEGNNITLTANLNPVMEGATFRWLEDNVEMDPETYTADGNTITLHKDYRYDPYNFSVEFVNELGCTSVGQALVYVNEAPVVNITVSDTVLCVGGEITLTASLNDWNATDLVYEWFDGEELMEGVTLLSNVYQPAAGAHHFHARITQLSSGCVAESNVIDVMVNGAPVIESVGTPQTSICYGGQLTITAAPADGNQDGDTYTWYRNGILMEGATAATIYDTPEIIDNNAQQYVYTAILTRPAPGCTSDAVTSDVVTVYPNPVVVITGDQHVCETDSVFLIANVDTVGMNVGGLHYTWYESGQIRDNMGYNLGDNNFYAEYMYARTEPYRFTVDVWRDDMGAGCISHSAEYLVYVYPQPVVNITATETEICENGQVTLTANLNDYNATDLIYQWYTVGEEMSVVAVDYAEDGGFVYDTIYTPVYNNIPGATTATYTTNLTETTTLGVMVRQTTSECWANDAITITVHPIPVVTDIKVNFLYDTANVCDGAEVTLTALIDAYDADGAVYTWFRNGELIEGVTGPVFSENVYTDNENVTTYHYSAIVTLPASGCVSAMSADAGVVIVGNSPASVVVSGNTVICDGGVTTLYANVVPAQPATYQWFMDNAPMTDSTNNNITVGTAGSYKVIAYFNGCSTESDAVVVTVEETPQLEVTAVETTFCAGGSTVITAEATGWNNGNVNYNWSNGFQGSTYTFDPTFSGTYTFYVTASQATSGCVAVDSIVINVNELPATPVVEVDNAVVCDGGQVTLMVTNPNNNAVYTWYRNGVVIEGAHNYILTESPVTVDGDLTTYVYTVTSTLPMSGCTSLTSIPTTVTVIPTPVVAVSVEGNTTVCEGGSTTLHANVSPAGDMYTYQWYKDNVLIEGANTSVLVVSEAARETAYNFSVVVSANAGCNVTAYAPAITFVTDPVVVATISNEISCVGGTATLNAIVDGGVAGVNGLNGYTYAWYRNYAVNDDPNTPYSTTELVGGTAQYTTTGTEDPGYYSYWVTVTSNYGCQSTSEPVNYTVIPDPVITIARLADMPAAVCDGGSTAIKAIVTGGYGTASYQWYKNGNILVGETNQILNINSLTYGVNDTYSVEVIQTGVGCSNVGVATVSDFVSVNPAYTVNISGFGNVCEGGTLTLTATVNGVVPGDVLSYQWYKIFNGSSAVAINGATSAQYSTSDLLLGNSYDYYVVVTSTLSGCSVVSTSVPANVVAAPTVVIQGANTVCEGGDLTLNAFVTGGVEGAAYTYVWEWTGASAGTMITAVPTFVPNLPASDAAAPYYFTVTIFRNDSTGCTATSAAHEVNVLAAPSVSVTADNYYVCQNGEVTFTAHVSPVGAYNYVWTINGVEQPVNASTVTASIANVGTISATVVVSAANASASCSASATIATPVQVVAAPSVTIAADHTTMCAGGTVTLSSIVNVNGNIPSDFSYQWLVNGFEIPGAISSTFVQPLTAAGEYIYTLNVTQNNNLGCSSTSSAPVTVQVAEQPVVYLTSADGLSICEGGTISMTGIVTNYNNTVNGATNSDIYGAMTFNWTSNGVLVPGGSNVVNNSDRNQISQTLNTVGNYSYQVTVDAAGYNCQPQASNIYVVNVVGDPSWTEVHVYSNNGTDACLGEMVILAASIQGGVAGDNGSTDGHIQWIVTDENGNTMDVSGGLGGSSYDIPSVAGTYIYTPTFVGNIGNGCQLTNTDEVQVAVTVHELPTATFTSGDGVSICSNDPSASAELVIAFTGVAPFTYEVVDDHGNVVAHATTQANTATIYVAPSTQTTYRITLIQDAYCENTSFGADAVATVYVNEIEFTETVFESGCDNPGFVTVSFNMISGNPTANFTVIYENGLQASGTISNNTATFAAPTTPGDYPAVITIDGCSYDIIVRVLVGDFSFGGTLPIMDQRWNDVVVVNNNPSTNGGHLFVSFQWYKNGVAIPGAVYSNYQEIGGLNGFYSVELVEQDADGNMVTYKTCEMYFSSTSSVKVYPVPANVRQEITIELDLTSEELEGAVLDIYSVTGAHINHVTDLRPITKIEGFKAQGTYFGRILTGTNEIKTVKFVIVK